MLKDDIESLIEDLGFIHISFAYVREKRKAVRKTRCIGGTKYENALRELDIAKSWRRVHLRHIFER